MATILGIESTCDETGAAVVRDGRVVRSNVIATQFELHGKYRGVVPEIASRAHVENILPVINDAMAQAGVNWTDLDAIAVAHRPGLIGSLLVGVTAAKTLAWALSKPLVGVDHVQAHLYSVVLESNQMHLEGIAPATPHPAIGVAGATPSSCLSQNPDTPLFPAVGLVCSGGHTAIYHVRAWHEIERLGGTIDDAVGEAYDKVAAILGQGYPGGPILDRLAADGDPAAIPFPRTMLARDSLDFSFSGLKTAVLYHVRGVPRRGEDVKSEIRRQPPGEAELRDIAASFQAACIDVILKKLRRAVKMTGARSIVVGGGVSANRGLRAALPSLAVPIFLPALPYCTDNAAMSAGLAQVHLSRGQTSRLDLDAIPFSAMAPTIAARIAPPSLFP